MLWLIGAGALGRLWAACLPEGKRRFIARPGHPASTLRFEFQKTDGEVVPVRAELAQANGLIRESDLLMVFTKADDTLPALESLVASVAPEVPIILFQNGMSSHEAVAARYPARPILSASTTEGANRPDSSTVVHAGTGTTWIGGLNPAGKGCCQSVISNLCSSGLSIQATDNIREKLWRKLVINAGINPYTALLDVPNGDILSASLYLDTIDDLCAEMAAILAKHHFYESPDDLRQSIEEVARKTARNCSSMRADVLKGRRTEIDAINGHFVAEGMRLNIPVEVNRFLVNSVHQLR